MNKKYIFLLVILFITTAAQSASSKSPKIIAYPNPVNFKVTELKISPESGEQLNNVEVTIEVYDLSGDLIYRDSKSKVLFDFSNPIKWKGYSDNSKQIGSGLFILKIIVDYDNGDKEIKILRVLVKK